MKYTPIVIGHPRMKTQLHRMRITGKPIRYIMEIMQPTFGKEFNDHLQKIKNLVEIMGEIHDEDVFISELTMHLNELRSYNRTKSFKNQKFQTTTIIELINSIREKRVKDYNLLCKTLKIWNRENFRKKLVNSMELERINQINFMKQVK